VQSPSVENIFSRSWNLLTRNWALLVPGLLVGLIVGILGWLLTPPPAENGDTFSQFVSLGAQLISMVILAVISASGLIVTQCTTAGMAGEAWQRGVATFAAGQMALRRDTGRVLVVAAGMLVLGIVAALLALPTLGLSLLAFYLLTLYAIPAAVVGERAGMDALAESYAIARSHLGSTFVIALLLFVVHALGGGLEALLRFAPLLGPVLAAIIKQVVVAYATLVVVGTYLSTRGQIPPPPEAQEPWQL
jgi:hypothetical protein